MRYAARGAAELQSGSEEHVEALVYCSGALKNLTNDEASLRRLASAGVAGVACDLARACAARATTRHVARLAAQAAGALRNLSGDRGALKPLEAGSASRALAALLVPFEGDADVVLHAARALAKLSLHEGTRRGWRFEAYRKIWEMARGTSPLSRKESPPTTVWVFPEPVCP